MTNKTFTFKGVVQKNLGRGKELGYPTANVQIPADYPEGIFFGTTCLNNKKYPSLVFIGKPLTFGESDKKAEMYILDFDADIYGQTIEIEVLEKIRENEKFASAQKLVEQIQEDERRAREYFKVSGL